MMNTKNMVNKMLGKNSTVRRQNGKNSVIKATINEAEERGWWDDLEEDHERQIKEKGLVWSPKSKRYVKFMRNSYNK